MQIFWGGLAVLLVFGLVVCFHELGHFLMAKWSGIGVEIFSFGMGPRAFGKKIGETDYRVSWLPLGGYVKMQGDEETEGGGMAAAQGGDDRPDAARPGRDASRDYDRHPKWQRLLVMVGGPLFNLILTLAIFTFAFYGEQTVRIERNAPPVIADLVPDGVGEKAGVRVGDLLLSVCGTPVATSAEAGFQIQLSTKGECPLTVRRGAETLNITATPKIEKFRGESAGSLELFLPHDSLVFGEPPPDSPAAVAGVKAGDVYHASAGKALHELTSEDSFPLFDKQRTALDLTVIRDGALLTLAMNRPAGALWGLKMGETRVNGPGQAVRAAFAETRRLSSALGQFVSKMVNGRSSLRGMSGPVGIVRMIGGTKFDNARQYAGELLALAAFISLQLGILNLLPIPALDGGHILILLLEGAFRRDFSRSAKEKIIAGGFYLLLALIVVLVISDVLKLFHR